MGETVTLKGRITMYRSQFEDISKKIHHLDVLQQCLAEMSKMNHSGSMEPLNPVPSGRVERVKEETTLVEHIHSLKGG